MVDYPGSVVFDYVRPGARRTTFQADLIYADGEIVIMSHRAHPSKPLHYAGQCVIDDGFDVVWFLFQGQPYDIGRFYRPDGTWTGYYVDILEPVRWNVTDTLKIDPLVDLALDLWVAPDGSYQVLDEDEYSLFVAGGELSPAQASQVQSTLHDLVVSLEDSTVPPARVREFHRDSA